jgi:DNA invertase Pin-like site-specific DNA recombinase
MTVRAALYARISSDKDDTRLGVDRQIEDCKRLCKERDWTVIERRRTSMALPWTPLSAR